MSFMPPTDSMFLLAESREHPMHVGGLQLFVPPEDSGPRWVRDMVETVHSMDQADISPVFRKRPAPPVNSLGNTWWTVDDEIDIQYHVRHSAVPYPGRIRELLQMTSRWHGSLLDRHRPLWEMHVVEGLEDGRVAVYTKVHHAAADGVSALRLLQKGLVTDPAKMDCPSPLAARLGGGGLVESSTSLDVPRLLRSGASVATQALGLAPATLKFARKALDKEMPLPLAPKTMLNGKVGGARRFAAQSWEIERIHGVAKASGTTINDVVLAMCSGALRRYLIEHNALPDKSLTAMVPVSLTLRSDPDGQKDAGNSVGVIVVSLATDVDDGPTRLEEIHYSVNQSKGMLSELTPLQILAMSAAQMFPLALGPVPGWVDLTRPPFNVIISNVPGPTEHLYWNGARLDGIYPASIALDGQAVNITLTSRKGYLDFGIVGCRRSVPSLQRLLTHLEDALAELEKAWV